MDSDPEELFRKPRPVPPLLKEDLTEEVSAPYPVVKNEAIIHAPIIEINRTVMVEEEPDEIKEDVVQEEAPTPTPAIVEEEPTQSKLNRPNASSMSEEPHAWSPIEVPPPRPPRPERNDRPPRAMRGVRPIPRPTPKGNSNFLIGFIVLNLGSMGILGLFGWQRYMEDRALEETPEAAVEAAVEAVPEAVPEVAPEPVVEAVPEAVPEVVPEPVPEVMPEAVPEAVPETVPVAAPVAPEVVPVATPAATVVEVAKLPAAPPVQTGPVLPAPIPPLSAYLTCPAHACERFGNLVMVNRGPLTLYSDPACKKPLKVKFSGGQTIKVAPTATTCYAVSVPR